MVAALTTAAPAVVLHTGSKVRPTACAYDRQARRLGLPPAILDELGIIPGQDVHVLAQDHGRHLYLGPLIGIWLARVGRQARDGAIADDRGVIREARAVGTVPFFFELSGVDRGSKRVDGWVERDGAFAPAVLPLPDVIYNRATFPDRQERSRAAVLRKELTDRDGVVFLNRANAYGKQAVYEALDYFPLTAHLAPETVPFDGSDSLKRMLARHASVYLKAGFGSLGSDVVRVRDVRDGWEIAGRRGGIPVRRKFTDVDRMATFLLEFRGDEPWVIQQAIGVPCIEGSQVDVRAFLQKDKHGRWQVPRVMVRVGTPGEVVASTHLGGRPFSLADFLARHGDEVPQFVGIETKATAVALRVAETLEARYGLLGEVAVDLGVDADGRVWVFEANAKPRHRSVSGLPQSIDRYPFLYAIHLAALSWSGRHSGLSWPVLPGQSG